MLGIGITFAQIFGMFQRIGSRFTYPLGDIMSVFNTANFRADVFAFDCMGISYTQKFMITLVFPIGMVLIYLIVALVLLAHKGLTLICTSCVFSTRLVTEYARVRTVREDMKRAQATLRYAQIVFAAFK